MGGISRNVTSLFAAFATIIGVVTSLLATSPAFAYRNQEDWGLYDALPWAWLLHSSPAKELIPQDTGGGQVWLWVCIGFVLLTLLFLLGWTVVAIVRPKRRETRQPFGSLFFLIALLVFWFWVISFFINT